MTCSHLGSHVAVVDDDAEVRATLAEYLEAQGLRLSPVAGGAELRALFAEAPADLVVLDLRMPGEDGLSLARWLRAEHGQGVGIIMLTALGDVVDRVVGLEMGADDYVAKPVDPRELLARVKAVLRRTRTPAPAVDGFPESGNRVVALGRHRLDLDAHKLFGPDGEPVPLTAMEFDLLRAFAENPNRVLTRDRLLDLAHSRDWEPFDRSIDVRIARIRRKIEADPSKPQVIKTIRGAGYIFSPREGRGI